MELAEGLAPPMNAVCSRAFAARPRQRGSGRRTRTFTLLVQSQPACRFAHPRTTCVPGEHRDQDSNLESSGSDPDALPIPPSLWSRRPSGGGGQTPPPPLACACARVTKARMTLSHGGARIDAQHSCVVVPSWVFSCQRAGTIATDPLIGGNSRPGQKRKAWRFARPLR